MTWQGLLLGFAAGLCISVLTTPVGVSGAVFLLPVQLDVLHVPNPQVTPTNLLFNVVAGPGALFRYRRQGQLMGPLTRQMLAGTLPGVAIGAVLRVYLASDAATFRILAAALLLPTGLWLLTRGRGRGAEASRRLTPRTVVALSLAVGIAGGVYGIGGGSILGPILVGVGVSVAEVAPAALASTFLTSITGALAYTLLSVTAGGSVAPNWTLGLICGVGGLIGGYIGARIHSRLPESLLRAVLGLLAVALAGSYLVATLT
ncbi:sulfite exporter TauE/SafE family protein [Pseudonocardia bannensis]|uniref:Probable membrane transporter protein n=1 Tax=Pseudonocardia bannensis TaxID=630973 RepID=A0A848DGB1_9PSEU|nr:sulfite exporter TauE/SafE family protein [Pseudonocardia bannensis]NMH91677.1 sulfite exporter TauE/SafE family protein [Pseudonocardia bannensis]